MNYISLDLETTGINPKSCQILEVGAIYDNGNFIESLPRFHRYIKSEEYKGEPIGLSMNASILEYIGKNPDKCITEGLLGLEFGDWLNSLGISKIVMAGKNYGLFDSRFLDENHSWKILVAKRIHYRCIDPAHFFIHESDTVPPNLETCCLRAGIGIDKGRKHTAMYDAELVVKLVRKGLTLCQMRGK